MTAMTVRHDGSAVGQFVTIRIGGQLFGLSIDLVHEVFSPQQITPVPLAPDVIEGVLNLRGRIVTTINMRRLLGFPERTAAARMAVGIEHKDEAYGLIIDEVGEVLALDPADTQPNPANLDRRWAEVSRGVHRLASELMLVLDIERALGRVGAVPAAA